jgi:hypothetical protein
VRLRSGRLFVSLLLPASPLFSLRCPMCDFALAHRWIYEWLKARGSTHYERIVDWTNEQQRSRRVARGMHEINTREKPRKKKTLERKMCFYGMDGYMSCLIDWVGQGGIGWRWRWDGSDR